jgi:hypothetical protein
LSGSSILVLPLSPCQSSPKTAVRAVPTGVRPAVRVRLRQKDRMTAQRDSLLTAKSSSHFPGEAPESQGEGYPGQG